MRGLRNTAGHRRSQTERTGLERHGGRTPEDVFTRIAQRLLALAAAIWHNWTIRTTTLRSLTAYDH